MKKNDILPFFFALLVLLSACKEDDPDPNEVFVGTYQMNASCNFTNGSNAQEAYSLTISKGTDASNIAIQNLFGSGQSINATVSGTSFNISQAPMTIEGSQITISGTGNLSGTSLNINYSLSTQGQVFGNCIDSGSKN